jgi:hypothetical protein
MDCTCKKCQTETQETRERDYAAMELRVVAALATVVRPPIDWSVLTCQDASPLSRGTFIPCGAPACVVIWHQRDRRAYLMCVQCADHNVRNRGGKLLTWKGQS